MATLAQVIPIDANQSLYEIRDHLQCLFDSLEGIEDPDLKRQAELELDAYLVLEVRKVDRITGYLAYCESQQKHAADEIKRLQARKQMFERQAERVESSVQRVMQSWDLKKLEGRTSSLALRACPPSVDVVDIAQVPDAYKRVTITETVDKTAAKVAMAAGEEIPGLRLETERKSVVRR